MPVSATASRANPSCPDTETEMDPLKVNFNALESRFITTLAHISRSMYTGSLNGGQSIEKLSPALSTAESNMLASSAVYWASSTGSKLPAVRPASSREKSSSVFTSLSSRSPLRWMISIRCRWWPGRACSASTSASSAGPSSSVRGVRSSWLMLVKNAVLAASSSASSSARRRSAS